MRDKQKRIDSHPTAIKGSVSAKHAAAGATLIRVQLGPDRYEIRADVRQALDESLEDLLVRRGLIRDFEHRDSIADALYACEFEGGYSLGFAVNNSGLIICGGAVRQARQLTSGKVVQVEPRLIERAFGCTADDRVAGGPVFNLSNEALGICVGRTRQNFVIVQPWSSIKSCIKMQWER